MKRRVMTTLLSVAIAFGLWFYVVNVVSPESDDTFRNIPVVFEGEGILEERGLMITAGKEATVTLKLVGNRTDLVKVNSQNITVRVDLSRIYEAGEHALSYSISYPSDVPSDAFTVQSREPATITLRVEEKISKDVPVHILYQGSLEDGLIYDKQNASINPQTVTVTGPSRVVEQITQARVEVDLAGRTGSIIENFGFTLCDSNGNPVATDEIVTDVNQIRLELKIQRVKEIPLVLAVAPTAGALKENTVITQSHTSIRVSGSEAALEDLNEIVLPQIDLRNYLEDTTLEFPIILPEGVTNLTGVDKVQVTVDLPQWETKQLVLTAFQVEDVPAGMEVEILTQQLTVTVRGPKEQIITLTADQLAATVSFAGAEIGTEWFHVGITVLPECDVDVVGSYSVSATIRAATQEGAA